MNDPANIIYVVFTGIALVLTIVGVFIKSNREAERFESWLKTHEKEITELKQSRSEMNDKFNQEHRRLETMIGGIAINIGKIDTKLQLFIDGRIKSLNEDKPPSNQ